MVAQTSRTSSWLKGRRRCGSLWLRGQRRCSSRDGRGWAMVERSGGGFWSGLGGRARRPSGSSAGRRLLLGPPSPRSSWSREPTAGVDARGDAASHWNPWFVWGKFAHLSFLQKRFFADAERLCAVDSFMQEKG
jgi:hypothetical protein